MSIHPSSLEPSKQKCFSNVCNEVVYPPDHDFIFRFLKIFLINISMNLFKIQTFFCIIKHLLKYG